METINERLYDLFMKELHELELGHGYDYERLSYMRSIVTTLLYLRYAVLDNADIIRILASFEEF